MAKFRSNETFTKRQFAARLDSMALRNTYGNFFDIKKTVGKIPASDASHCTETPISIKPLSIIEAT